MLNNHLIKSLLQHRHLRSGVAVLCVVLIGVVWMYGDDWFVEAPTVAPLIVTTTATSSEVVLVESTPVRLRIPRIELDVPFVAPLGLAQNGEVEVPTSFTEVGWYKYSPTPGELGPSVVLGHVDSVSGPAVFYSLGQVEVGDEILVEREDASIARFVVERLERYEQVEFPTESVYGNIDHAGIRLITCSGTFDRDRDRYTHNLVVYGRLVTEAIGEDEVSD